MMRPAKMSRIAVVGSREKRPVVLSILHDMGVMQVETLSSKAASLVKNEIDSITFREVNEELLRIRALRAALPPLEEGKAEVRVSRTAYAGCWCDRHRFRGERAAEESREPDGKQGAAPRQVEAGSESCFYQR